MQVAVFNGAGKPVTVEEFEDAALGEGEVRIGIGRCGICGSDVTLTSGSPFDMPAGLPFGHEFSGEVIETGRGVSRLKVGDRLACFPTTACGECASCLSGRPLYCSGGPPLFGGFGERMVIPETAGVILPASVSIAEGALVEPMACGRRALRIARMQKGDTLLVLGAGTMALSVIYWARIMGAGRIAVLTRSAKRDEMAMSMGADTMLRFDDENPQAAEEALGGAPAIVAECIGKEGLLSLAVERVRLGGTVLSMGMCTTPDPVIPAMGTFKEVSLHFPLAYSIEDFTETVRAFDAGNVRPETMVSDTIALDALPAMLEELRGSHPHLKVQVDPNRGCSHD